MYPGSDAHTWQLIGYREGPVVGNPQQFERAADRFDTIRDTFRDVEVRFREILVERQYFVGETAAAIRDQLRGVQVYVDDVPRIATRVSTIFNDHTRELRYLQQQVSNAAARAKVRWDAHRSAERDYSHHSRHLERIQHQINSLPCGGLASYERSRLEALENDARWDLKQAQQDCHRAERRLDDSRAEWKELRGREEDLNEHSARQLTSIQLGDMADPNTILQIFLNAAHKVLTMIAELRHKLAEYLEMIATIALIFIVAAALIAALFVPGGLLAVLPMIVTALKMYTFLTIGTGASKVFYGFMLVATGKKSWKDQLIDSGFLVLDLLTFKIGGTVARVARNVAGGALGGASRVLQTGANALRQVGDDLLNAARHFRDAAATIVYRIGTTMRRLLEASETLLRRGIGAATGVISDAFQGAAHFFVKGSRGVARLAQNFTTYATGLMKDLDRVFQGFVRIGASGVRQSLDISGRFVNLLADAGVSTVHRMRTFGTQVGRGMKATADLAERNIAKLYTISGLEKKFFKEVVQFNVSTAPKVMVEHTRELPWHYVVAPLPALLGDLVWRR